MRVTNSMMVSTYLNDLNSNTNRLMDVQRQMSTGRKYSRVSDDPISAIYANRAKTMLNRTSEYQHNVSVANGWLTQVESVLSDMNDMLTRMTELAVQASNDSYSEEDRAIIAAEVAQMRDHMLDTLNSTIGDRYLFGGYSTTGDPPFAYDESTGKLTLTYNGEDVSDPANWTGSPSKMEELMGESLSLDVGNGIEIELSLSGLCLAVLGDGDDNIIKAMDDFYNALNDGATGEELSEYIDRFGDFQNNTLRYTAEIGGRMTRIEMLENRYTDSTLNYTTMLSDAEDVDEAEIIMEYMMAYSMYSAALATGSYVLQPTLMDFLS